MGQSARLGLSKGITELYGIPFTGAVAWLMRWFFFLHFMPLRRTMAGAAGDWLFLLFRRQRKELFAESPAAPEPGGQWIPSLLEA